MLLVGMQYVWGEFAPGAKTQYPGHAKQYWPDFFKPFAVLEIIQINEVVEGISPSC